MSTLDLSFLTQEERDIILSVLQRDEDLKKTELDKKKILQSEISQIKRASAVKVGRIQKSRECARCHTELGMFRNSGELCPRCHHLICAECRHVKPESRSYSWLCTLCHKQRLLPAVTGDWYYDQIKNSTESLNKENAFVTEPIEPTELIKTSIFTAPISEKTGRFRSRENPFKNVSPNDFSREITPSNGNMQEKTTNADDKGEVENRLLERVESPAHVTHIKTKYHSSDSDSSSDEGDTTPTQSEENLHTKNNSVLVAVSHAGDKSLHKSLGLSTSYDSSQLNSTKEQSLDGSVRPRSKSLTPLNSTINNTDEEYTVEELTQTKFRRCSTEQVQPDETQAEQGKQACLGSSVASMSASYGLEKPDKPPRTFAYDTGQPENSDKRRLSLTRDVQQKSPDIGRRIIDISADFLREFSDSDTDSDEFTRHEDEDEEEDADEDEQDGSNISYHSFHRLSVIDEAETEGSGTTPLLPITSLTDSPKPPVQLKLNTDMSIPVTEEMQTLTPLTPDKYSTFWSKIDSLTDTSVDGDNSESDETKEMPNYIVEDENYVGTTEKENEQKEPAGLRFRSLSSDKFQRSVDTLNQSNTSSHEQLSSSNITVNKPAVKPVEPLPVPIISIIDDKDQARIVSQAERSPSSSPSEGFYMQSDEIDGLSDEERSCRSDGENIDEEDEDIDGLFAEAKQTRIWRPSAAGRQISSESLASVYSEAGFIGGHAITGDIELSWYYNENRSTLSVKVHSCRNLTAINEQKNTSDPYVKIYLLPDRTKTSKHKTKVKRGTLNPVYNQSFSYNKLSQFQIVDRTLQVSVWNFHRLGQSEFLGEVCFPLTAENLKNRNTPTFYPLHEKAKADMSELRGDIHLSLKYVLSSTLTQTDTGKKSPNRKPPAGELHVNILSARNLLAKKSSEASDPFVKCVIQPEKNRKRNKYKTNVIKNNLNPSWNETFIFNEVLIEELSEICVELSVWNHDRITSNDFLGAVKLNSGRGISYGDTAPWMDSYGKELDVWNEMVNNPDMWIDAWIPLRCTLSS